MDITQALAEAANIMLLGMVCVFVFLGLLVVALKVLEIITGSEAAPVVNAPTSNVQVDSNVAVAITAAVHKFRQTKLND